MTEERDTEQAIFCLRYYNRGGATAAWLERLFNTGFGHGAQLSNDRSSATTWGVRGTQTRGIPRTGYSKRLSRPDGLSAGTIAQRGSNRSLV